MSKIYFQDSYIIVEPSFSENEMHKHSFLHIFIGCEDGISVSTESGICTGNIIFTNRNVAHCAPQGHVDCILLIDPTSVIAGSIRSKYLQNNGVAVLSGASIQNGNLPGKKEEQVQRMLVQMGLLPGENETKDERIQELINEIKTFQFSGSKVSEIAEVKHYSESRLTHLFKKETGITLKGYLSLRQAEYVCRMVCEGNSITEASLRAGFSSPSHFAAVFKQMTGISLSDVI